MEKTVTSNTNGTNEGAIAQAMRTLRIGVEHRERLQQWLDGDSPVAQALRVIAHEGRRQHLARGEARPADAHSLQWLGSRLDADPRPRVALIGTSHDGTITCAQDVIVGSLAEPARRYIRRIAETALECGARNVAIGLRGASLGGANAIAQALAFVGIRLDAVVVAKLDGAPGECLTIKEPTIEYLDSLDWVHSNATRPEIWRPRRKGGSAGETQDRDTLCKTLDIDPTAPWARMMSHRGPARSDTEARVHAARDLTREWLATRIAPARDDPQILSTEQAERTLRDYLTLTTKGERYERLLAAYLDVRLRIITIEEISRGTMDRTPLNASVMLHTALALGARGLILAHWHPSGDPTPSPGDRAITEEFERKARRLDVEVVDHLVIGDEDTVSLRETGGWNGA